MVLFRLPDPDNQAFHGGRGQLRKYDESGPTIQGDTLGHSMRGGELA
jgi:hypothetical protein